MLANDRMHEKLRASVASVKTCAETGLALFSFIEPYQSSFWVEFTEMD
jgi:hypothetical protein